MQLYAKVANCIHNHLQTATCILWNSYFTSVDKLNNDTDDHKLNSGKHNCVLLWLTAAFQNPFKNRTCSSQNCTVCFDCSISSKNQRVTQVARLLELKQVCTQFLQTCCRVYTDS